MTGLFRGQLRGQRRRGLRTTDEQPLGYTTVAGLFTFSSVDYRYSVLRVDVTLSFYSSSVLGSLDLCHLGSN